MVRLRFAFSVFLFVALTPTAFPIAAHAGCRPDPFNCEVPAGIVLCPAGDIVFRARMLNISSVPLLYGCEGQLDFCSASGWVLAAGQPAGITFVQPCEPMVEPDSNGVDAFALKAGGHASAGSIHLSVVGIHIRDLGFASPDQNGDLTVDARDMAAVLKKIFAAPQDPTGDLNLDGRVDVRDLNVVIHHLGHHS